jgi:exo-beta-1,3-glucanase (GH17 family)
MSLADLDESTETGWPQSGPTVVNAVPGLEALQTFWWQVLCSSFESLHFFWYDLDDLTASPSFAMVDTNYNTIIDMTCS